MSDQPSDTAGPAVLRQEGPHRVKVAPGSQSALSTSVGLGTKRLRPAVGAVPMPDAAASAAAELGQAQLRSRAAGQGSTTEVRRLPGRAPVNSRFTPGQADAVPESRMATDALERRLSALAELNSKTSRSVTSLERLVLPPQGDEAAPPAGDASAQPPAKRGLFNRRSS